MRAPGIMRGRAPPPRGSSGPPGNSGSEGLRLRDRPRSILIIRDAYYLIVDETFPDRMCVNVRCRIVFWLIGCELYK